MKRNVSIAYVFLDLLLTIPNTLVGLHVGKEKCGNVVYYAFFVVHVGFGGHLAKQDQVGAGFFAPLLHGSGIGELLLVGTFNTKFVAELVGLYEVGDVRIENSCFQFLDVVVGVDVFAGLVFYETDDDGGLATFVLHVFFEPFAVREFSDHFIGDHSRVRIVPAPAQIDLGSGVYSGYAARTTEQQNRNIEQQK